MPSELFTEASTALLPQPIANDSNRELRDYMEQFCPDQMCVTGTPYALGCELGETILRVAMLEGGEPETWTDRAVEELREFGFSEQSLEDPVILIASHKATLIARGARQAMEQIGEDK